MDDIRTRSYTSADPWLIELLSAHLPYSLPVLRRCQWSALNPPSPSRPIFIIFSASPHMHENPEAVLHTTTPFCCALVDYGAGVETQMWMYSTLEDAAVQSSGEFDHLTESGEGAEGRREVEGNQIVGLFEELRTLTVSLPREITDGPHGPGALLLGGVHDDVLEVIQRTGAVDVEPRPSGKYDKWLFQLGYVPEATGLAEGLVWSEGSLADCEIAASRTDIDRVATTLVEWPNVFVKTDDGTPIAWGFLDTAGCISSLYCEKSYRGDGIARRVASRLLLTKLSVFGDDGWASADVSPDNVASQGVCRSIGGKPAWVSSWVIVRV